MTAPGDDATRDQDATEAASRSPRTHERIGNFLVLEKLGEGGMGEVYAAEQTAPVRRRVALKVIKRGMDTRRVIARFEAERQALALMDHPSVAKVFEAGSTPGGRPYFVMEYVQGVPITEHCDRNRLNNRERLELFIEVCAGVQHAHQKAIIHRDLKPSNVLVSVQDGTVVPKAIDFGVAKATTQRLSEKTVYTELGMLIGTPEYMSPEQAEMTGQNVDTRTDVYSLGVILYELLTGALPFDSAELRSEGYESVRRVIRDKEPPRPSARVSTGGDGRRGERAQQRRADPAALQRELSGDLDWITMKALDKDRARRYGSPAELAADLRRYLADEPVLARPPSARYRAAKFARRHTFGVAVACLAALLVLGFAGTMIVQAKRIADERDRADAAATLARKEARTAKRVSTLMVDLFARSNPDKARGETITVREVLDAGAEQVLSALDDEPEVQARLLATIGDSYRALSLLDKSEAMLERALEKTIEVHGEQSVDTARIKVLLAYPLIHRADYERGERLSREALVTMRRLLPEDDPEIGEPINMLAFCFLRTQRNYEEGEALLREALELQLGTLGQVHGAVATTLDHLGWILMRQERRGEAAATLRRALEVEREVTGGISPRMGFILQRLGWVLVDQGRLDEGLAIFQQAREVNLRLYGGDGDHPEFAFNARAIGETLARKGDHAEALVWTEQAVTINRKHLNSRNPVLARSLVTHGKTLRSTGELAGAEAALSEAVAIFRSAFGNSHANVAECLDHLREIAASTGRHELADSMRRQAETIRSELEQRAE